MAAESAPDSAVAFHETVALDRATHRDHGRNVSAVFTLDGPLDEDLLDRSVRWLGAHHDAFRTSFHRGSDGGWTRRLHPPALSLHRADVAPAALRDTVRGLVAHLHPLHTAPLVTLTLVRLGPERAALVLVADHVVMDFAGARVALRHLGAALQAGGLPDLPPPPQPRDLVAPLAALLAPVWADRSWARPWPADGFQWPPDAGLPGGDAPDTGVVLAPIASAEAVAAAARTRGVSPGALHLAAFTEALRTVTGRTDAAFSLARAGRDGSAQRRVVASLVYTDTFAPLPDADLPAAAEAFLTDRSPWRRVYNATVDPPSRRILLNVLGGPLPLSVPGVVATHRLDLGPPPQLSPFHDVVVQLVELGGASVAAGVYRTCVRQRATVEQLLSAFSTALGALAAPSEAP